MKREHVVIIMAGGLGKRMNSDLPKVLHIVKNKPMLVRVIQTAMETNPQRIFIVVGKYYEIIKSTIEDYDLSEFVDFVIQEEPKGTGHAIMCARDVLCENRKVLILSGDVPLISKNTICDMLSSESSVCLLATRLENPTNYGRVIIENGEFQNIVEEKDCSEEEKKCDLINSGIYVFDEAMLCNNLQYLTNDNAQQEYYLTSMVEIIKKNEGVNVCVQELSQSHQYEIMGVNTTEQLEQLNSLL